jgi:hypothetical protein
VWPNYHWPNVVVLVLSSSLAVAVAYVVGFHSLRRLLFLDVLMSWNERPVSDVDDFFRTALTQSMKAVALYPTDAVRRRLQSHPRYHELSWSEPVLLDSETGADPAAFWVASDLEAWPINERSIACLARAVELPGSVVLVATAAPLALARAETRRAWARVLENYVAVELYEPSAAADGHAERPSPAQLERWWLECDPREQRVLQQLALSGYATPHPDNVPALKTLATRGLLDPETMTIAHPEMAELARRSVTPEDQQAWTEADRGTAWTALRVPLSTGVASLLAAVTLSKPELGMASALVPTLAASLPSVLKILVQMLAPRA